MVDLTKMKKKEIIWLSQHRCKAHSHTYLEHYPCFIREVRESDDANCPVKRRIGFLDIETTISGFKADFGMILCYCILDNDTGEILESSMTKNEIMSVQDERLTKQLVKDMGEFDRVVTYYGTRFDIPYIRTRAAINKVKFHPFDSIKHTDVYYMIRNKFKLSRSSLEVACRNLLGKTQKTHIGNSWMRVMTGDQRAMEYIIDHCRKDVKDLKELYDFAYQFVGRREASI